MIWSWVLEPSVVGYYIELAICVDIPDPKSVSEAFVCDDFGDAGEFPSLEVHPRWLGIPEHPRAGADEFGFTIAGYIGEGRRFVGDPIEDLMFGPVSMRGDLFAGVLVDVGWSAGKADGQNVVESVGVEVMDPSKEVVSIGVHRLGLGSIDLMRDLELRTFEPVGPIDHIGFAVGVEVPYPGPFAEIGFCEGLSAKGVDGSLRRLVLGNTRIYGACQEPGHASPASMRASP